ncbi:MAG: S8 family peptidase [Alphaproteobacteria bacterium]
MRFVTKLAGLLVMSGALLGAATAMAADYSQLRKGLGIPRSAAVGAAGLKDGETMKVLVELAPIVKPAMGILSASGSAVDQLGLRGIQDLVEFKHLPLLSLSATPEVIERLVESNLVSRVMVDDIHVVNMSQSNDIIRSGEAWKRGARGKGVSVAVLDTGVDTRHKAFAGRIAGEACFSSSGSFKGNRVTSACPGKRRSSTAVGSGRDCPSAYECSHGTHVAGTVAGGDAGYGGVAPAAKIVAVQVFSLVDGPACGRSRKCVTAYTSDIINALEWVYDKRKSMKIAAVNMSLGGGRYKGTCDREAIARAINLLDSAGVAVVIAAGNEGYDNSVASPACVSRAITVGSTDKRDRVSSFSNSNKVMDMWAPGGSIRSAVPGGGYGTKSGTSMAAPHVAGAFAIMRAAYPNAPLEDLTKMVVNNGPRIRHRSSGLTRNRLDVAAVYAAASKRWGDGKGGGDNDNDKPDDGKKGGGGLLDVVPGLGGLLGGDR